MVFCPWKNEHIFDIINKMKPYFGQERRRRP
jgi:hypothetical protein